VTGATTIDVMIVGAQKAGTTSLLTYLGSHPALHRQRVRELTFFSDHRAPMSDFDKRAGVHLDTGSGLTVGKLAGLMTDPIGLLRLRVHNPGVRVVVSLRDPVRRAYSAYWHARATGREPAPTFEDGLWGDSGRFGADDASRRVCAYIEHGLYAAQLLRLRHLFGAANVSVVLLEEFLVQPRRAVLPLAEAIGVDAGLLPDVPPHENEARQTQMPAAARLIRKGALPRRMARRLFTAAGRERVRPWVIRRRAAPGPPPSMASETEARLREFFAAPNADLSQLLERDVAALWKGRRD
jgi:hypothetical protein